MCFFFQDLRVSQNREGHNILFQIPLRGVEKIGFDEEEEEERAALEQPKSGSESGSDENDGELPEEYEASSLACVFAIVWETVSKF